ncbi:MAG: hypothetical protein R3300_05040 [Candidatus Promineifilaceae bacterium]|nr:hypothetical protein [Candidatus Promineifilaceae bacterium]
MLFVHYRLISAAIFLLGWGLGLAACSGSSSPVTEPSTPTPLSAAMLPDLGPAPDFNNKVWLNTEQPLTLAALRGRAILVEFWTFG